MDDLLRGALKVELHEMGRNNLEVTKKPENVALAVSEVDWSVGKPKKKKRKWPKSIASARLMKGKRKL